MQLILTWMKRSCGNIDNKVKQMSFKINVSGRNNNKVKWVSLRINVCGNLGNQKYKFGKSLQISEGNALLYPHFGEGIRGGRKKVCQKFVWPWQPTISVGYVRSQNMEFNQLKLWRLCLYLAQWQPTTLGLC